MSVTEDSALLTLDAVEIALIGAVMIDPAVYAEVSPVVSAKYFLSPTARTVFAVVGQLVAGGTRADAVTVLDVLVREHANSAPRDGWEPYLAHCASTVPSAAGAADYAARVVTWAQRRELRGIAIELEADARTGDPTALSGQCAERLLSIGDRNTLRPVRSARAAVDEFIESMGDESRAISTGLHDLDAKTGGLQRGDLIIVAGRPSMGKSAFAQNIAENNALRGRNVFVFSLEMSAASIAGRALCSRTGIPLGRLRNATLTDTEAERVAAVAAEFRALSLHICDLSMLSLARVHAFARQTRALHGLDLVIIDYLQLMVTEPAETRERAVAALSSGLKRLARDLDVPVVCLSQLNRGLENRNDKRPMLSDLRDSGAIEQDADTVLMLYRPAVYDVSADTREAELIIAKQRNGPTGTVPLRFIGDRFRFEDAGGFA